jgi:hypothetical protein
MSANNTELAEAGFLLAFHFPVPVRYVLLSILQTLQYKETSERVGKE